MSGVWTQFELDFGWPVQVAATEAGIVRLHLAGSVEHFLKSLGDGEWREDASAPLMVRARTELAEYYRGGRQEFELPLDLRGTSFQKRVWRALCEIPYGETISYAQLAERVESPRGFRAVGHANGSNPVCIVVPCHRVVAADGRLGGYGPGLDYKRALLALESFSTNSSSSSSRSTDMPMRSQQMRIAFNS